MEYPKIETLYVRAADTFRVTDQLRLPEYDLVKYWLLTEKIDGTNIRVFFNNYGDGKIGFGGRTASAQIPVHLMNYLQAAFVSEQMIEAFSHEVSVILYGEGYGSKIQKGGGNYRSDVSFRLFDVLIIKGDERWWLNWKDVEDVADKLGIKTVPVIDYNCSLDTATLFLRDFSMVAEKESNNEIQQEGIVARTEPLLLTRNGHRLMWKLKAKDYTGGKH